MLKSKVGEEIFALGHRMEPYYTAAFTLYKLESFFRNGRLEPKYKAARFHILLAVRMLADSQTLPRMNSHKMEKYCKGISEVVY